MDTNLGFMRKNYKHQRIEFFEQGMDIHTDSRKRRLLNGTILLKCRNDNNTRMSLRDAFVDLDDVMESFLTNSIILDNNYNVGGTFLATKDGLERIKSKIYKLKNKNRRNIPVQAVAIIYNRKSA